MSTVIFVNNSQENADEDVHAYYGENDKKKGIPVTPIIRWNPEHCKNNKKNIRNPCNPSFAGILKHCKNN